MTLVSNRSASMSSGLLLDPIASPTSDSASGGPRYRPYSSPNHHVTKGRYITSNDPRGYIPVYEYPLNGQWIMLDMDDGYVLWTGIWKALGNSKADIVKMVESQPDLAPQLRRVRGGYLKIQGTWMPYEIALRLARRVAWEIRFELIPLFGPTFPDTCLSPDQPGYGQIVKPGTGKRRTRRNLQAGHTTEAKPDWTVISTASSQSLTSPAISYSSNSYEHTARHTASSQLPRRHPEHLNRRNSVQDQNIGSPISLHRPYEHAFQRPDTSSSTHHRYSPYPHPVSAPPRSYSARTDLPPPPVPSSYHRKNSMFEEGENIVLPPIKSFSDNQHSNGPITLPPISSLDRLHSGNHYLDSSAVLRRLKSTSDDDFVQRNDINIMSRNKVDFLSSSVGRRLSIPASSSTAR
ncbi:hypothetical protein ABKN59_005251 [Abortiporus biennis]